MDDRLRAMASEAGFQVENHGEKMITECVDGTSSDLEEFARLIVADCLSVIESERTDAEKIGGSPEYDNALYDAARAIRERYGLPEPDESGLYI